MNDKLKDNTIVVTNYNYKVKILNELSLEKKLLNINFLSMKDLKEKVYFSYDEKTIYYLMSKYSLEYDVALIYLKNMYFISDKEYKNEKLKFLCELKKELFEEKLLYKDDLFLEYIKDKNIVFYGYNYFTKDEEKFIEYLGNYSNIDIISKEYNTYNHEVFKFSDIYDEVEYVAYRISKLIEEGISFDKIKLTNLDSEYFDIVKDIFKLFNLDIINPSKIISTEICNMFFEINGSIEERINILKDRYKDGIVLEKLVKIVNKYIVFEDLDIVCKMIKGELNNINFPCDVYDNTIEVIDYLNYPISDEYVFMVNFNQNSIPSLVKDEDYITDNMKCEVDLDTTFEENKKIRESVIKNILNIKNLVITYKERTPFKIYLLSDLISDLGFVIKDKSISLNDSYSDRYNKIKLSKKLDNYVKTGFISEDINYLYSNYNDLGFSSYDNKYKGIDKERFLRSIDNHFDLAYSSMDKYYKCPFRYYIANVLKLDIYEEKFETYLGSLFHYVLENNLKEGIEVHNLVCQFIKENDRILSKKEEFFVKKVEKDIEYVINIIYEQLNNTDLKKTLFENRVVIDKKYGDISVTFKGFIDKIMYKEEDNTVIAAIIDYKTGASDIKLSYVPFGLYMQLPVYLYLAKNSNKLNNVFFSGFYLQRVLNSEVKVDSKKKYEELKRENILLYGYSNSDEELLHKFDHTYKNSRFIKSMKVKNDGTFYGYSKVLDNNQIDKLINIVDLKIDSAIKDISCAKFDIRPKKDEKDVIGCDYCKFRDICFKENEDEELIVPDKDLSFLGGDIDA